MLDGQAIERRSTLADGAAIVLGSTSLRFRISPAEASTATVTRQHPIRE
jgi:hypothetical protein